MYARRFSSINDKIINRLGHTTGGRSADSHRIPYSILYASFSLVSFRVRFTLSIRVIPQDDGRLRQNKQTDIIAVRNRTHVAGDNTGDRRGGGEEI